jgi:polysaccharide pyruvyl transferase WcaK-like protein
MTIAIYDTYCGSLNSGDAIIMDAVAEQLNLLFPHEHKVGYPTHYPLSLKAIRRIKKSRMSFVGGTNLLSSNIHLRSRKNQWSIGQIGAFILKKHVILLGCGWKNYQQPNNWKSRLFYQTLLSASHLHSVRDSYSEKKMHDLGFANVVNTSCPTLWKLTTEHCAAIPREKAANVVFTLTDYRRHPEADTAMIHLLFNLYDKIYFWIQGAGDLAYLRTLANNEDLKKITLIGPSLHEYDQLLLDADNLDYIGTRLHAGIRAMQKKRRSIIIGVDNRAIEKRNDFNLTVIERDNPAKLSEMIEMPFNTKLILPTEKIAAWKAQFSTPESGLAS